MPAVFLILLWEVNGFSFNYHLNERASCPDTSLKTIFAYLNIFCLHPEVLPSANNNIPKNILTTVKFDCHETYPENGFNRKISLDSHDSISTTT